MASWYLQPRSCIISQALTRRTCWVAVVLDDVVCCPQGPLGDEIPNSWEFVANDVLCCLQPVPPVVICEYPGLVQTLMENYELTAPARRSVSRENSGSQGLESRQQLWSSRQLGVLTPSPSRSVHLFPV
ncbi:hypothetical protein MHYP_G00312900 [Metynnis hypsauchen]